MAAARVLALPLAAVAVLAALALTGCGERTEPVDALSPYPVTVRGAGQEPTVITRAPERIVALGPAAAELVAALGAGGRLVGVPSGIDVPEAAGARRVVRPSGLVDVEAVRALDPDLVIASAETDAGALATAAEGSTVYVQPERTPGDVVRATLELGFLLGDPPRARRLATSIRDELARVERRVADLPAPRVFADSGFFVSVGEATLAAELVRRAGGELVGLDLSGPLDACDVLDLEPDVVLRILDLQSPRPFELQFARCGAASLPRIEEVPADLVTTAGPRIGRALDTVASALHGDAA